MRSEERVHEVADRALPVFERWRGSGVALSRKDLCRKLGCSDRVLRRAVRELRCRGHLIVADPAGGYRFARHRNEVYEYTGKLISRIKALREVVDAMEDTAQECFGPRQEQLEMSL